MRGGILMRPSASSTSLQASFDVSIAWNFLGKSCIYASKSRLSTAIIHLYSQSVFHASVTAMNAERGSFAILRGHNHKRPKTSSHEYVAKIVILHTETAACLQHRRRGSRRDRRRARPAHGIPTGSSTYCIRRNNSCAACFGLEPFGSGGTAAGNRQCHIPQPGSLFSPKVPAKS